MTWSFDAPVRIGDHVFAAVVETRVSTHSSGRFFAITGRKEPLLYLMLHGETAQGIDTNGRIYDAAEIDDLYPQAISQLRAMKTKSR